MLHHRGVCMLHHRGVCTLHHRGVCTLHHRGECTLLHRGVCTLLHRGVCTLLHRSVCTLQHRSVCMLHNRGVCTLHHRCVCMLYGKWQTPSLPFRGKGWRYLQRGPSLISDTPPRWHWTCQCTSDTGTSEQRDNSYTQQNFLQIYTYTITMETRPIRTWFPW